MCVCVCYGLHSHRRARVVLIMPVASIVLRHGHIVVHVTSAEHVDAAVCALRLVDGGQAHPFVAQLSAASAAIMDAAAQRWLDSTVRSLNDAVCLSRRWLSPKTVKWMNQLNAAYSLSRHCSPADIQRRADEVASELRGFS